MAFKEKSAWITLAALIWIFGGYAWSLFEAKSFGAGTSGVMVASIVGFVVLLVIAHAVAAIVSPKSADAAEDERDRMIDLKAEEMSGIVLGTAAFFALVVALYEGRYLVANILFLGLAASEIVKNLYQIVLYRRSA